MAQGFLNGSKYDQKVSDFVLFIDRTIEELVVPEGVTVIGEYAFRGCTKLKSISLPKGITKIDKFAFYTATLVKEIVVPDGCLTIGESAFTGCYDLERVVLPDSITAIGATAFKTSNITEFIFPDKVNKICANILLGCSKLERVIAPSDCKHVEGGAFSNCYACMTYDFSKCKEVPQLLDTSAFKNIASGAKIYVPAELYDQWIVATNWVTFKDYIMPALTEGEATYPETFSQGLEYVEDWWTGNYTLVGRGSCTDSVIVIPTEVDGRSVTYIDDSFLQNDSIVEECWIPGVELISSRALDGCVNLKKLYLFCGSGLQSFSFINLPGLKYVKIGPEVSGITSGVFASSNKAVFDFSEATYVLYLDEFSAGEEFGEYPFIFVPPELYEEWKNDTNWAYYADRIFPALRP